ncbi:DUF2062 domain-containing protein [Sphingomicrobium sediminis]|uniref:DUF2062 domain-containing protein n=1 Tax=Sphingomicrobium sediminis TaxID=2950949 RepID=A0A9X2J349_9SPHN|nr:DUF2062 domain-containing protein [Sphingomicrobium sediminis]MCM8556946.1 DUF2062 domain-containing protein [Sphingomicrobium sediminis]
MGNNPGPLRRFLAKHAPTREELARSRWLKPVRRYIEAHEYWRFTRRSVPRAFFIGMFIGVFLMIPGTQMIGAALMCIPMRGNIPIAAALTWVSNPATTPVFLIGALEVGGFFGFETHLDQLYELYESDASIRQWFAWLFTDAAPGLIFGLFVIGLVLALVAYWVSLVGWRLWIGKRWRQRTD